MTTQRPDGQAHPQPRPGESAERAPILEARDVSKYFGRVVALEDVSFSVRRGEVTCLLGDNGAGKSTLIKILSGVHQPDRGTLLMDGEQIRLASPRDALARGIATVYQDLSVLPLMSITRNFFLGNEPTTGLGPLRVFDTTFADAVAREEMREIGIELRDTSQLVGTLSGGEQQTLAIARAEHFGARVLILDEPTSALGVKESAIVLRHIIRARSRGLGVVLITHNVQHALPVGDHFTVLARGRSVGNFRRGQLSADELAREMGGGEELEELRRELEELAAADRTVDPDGATGAGPADPSVRTSAPPGGT